MTIIKLVTRTIFKLIGYLLVILGQGLVLLTTFSSCLMNIVTGLLFIFAIILTFSDLPVSYKIVYWIIAIISGAISINIYTLPLRLVDWGRQLINSRF